MYNGIGLVTPRGSGTSGYVQKSLAYVKNKNYKTGNYKEVLEQYKSNPVSARKEPNEEILKHEILYKIECDLYKIKKDNEKNYKCKEDLDNFISKERTKLQNIEIKKLENNNLNKNNKSFHMQNLLKKVHNSELKDAFKIDSDYKLGDAFDTELQEQKKINIKKLKKKEIKRKEKEKAKRFAIEEKIKQNKEKKKQELELLRILNEQDNEIKKEIENCKLILELSDNELRNSNDTNDINTHANKNIPINIKHSIDNNNNNIQKREYSLSSMSNSSYKSYSKEKTTSLNRTYTSSSLSSNQKKSLNEKEKINSNVKKRYRENSLSEKSNYKEKQNKDRLNTKKYSNYRSRSRYRSIDSSKNSNYKRNNYRRYRSISSNSNYSCMKRDFIKYRKSRISKSSSSSLSKTKYKR